MNKDDLPKQLPNLPGIYEYLDNSGKVIYVGKAKNINHRINSYFRLDLKLGTKTSIMIKKASRIKYILTETELEALLLEADLIKRLRPKYNIRLKDDKQYKYIELNYDQEIPSLKTTRIITNKKSNYFGPFPDGTTVNKIIRDIRKMFGYCTQKKVTPGKYCLYHKLNLCPGVCGGQISLGDYDKHIKLINSFLAGKRKSVIRQLTSEMMSLSKDQKFEQATQIRDLIERIDYITQKFHTSTAFIDNPNLRGDIRDKELKQLTNILIEHSVVSKYFKLNNNSRIECYDISNISGTDAVGSMVVFINGESVKSDYRRFKIRFTKNNSDVDFMKEVLIRRFKKPSSKKSDNSFNKLPDLILVDGGIAQVHTALKVLDFYEIYLPVIGLAKKMEIVVLTNGLTINLSKNDPALQLLMRIRDEAHRYAKKYHVLLRTKII